MLCIQHVFGSSSVRGRRNLFPVKAWNQPSSRIIARVSLEDSGLHALLTELSPGHVDVIRAKICVKICLLCEFYVLFLTPHKTSVFRSID